MQVMVVVAVAGAHTREIWSRLPLEIAVAIEDRCRGWGPLEGSTNDLGHHTQYYIHLTVKFCFCDQ